jgi:hypothetical protein
MGRGGASVANGSVAQGMLGMGGGKEMDSVSRGSGSGNGGAIAIGNRAGKARRLSHNGQNFATERI